MAHVTSYRDIRGNAWIAVTGSLYAVKVHRVWDSGVIQILRTFMALLIIQFGVTITHLINMWCYFRPRKTKNMMMPITKTTTNPPI